MLIYQSQSNLVTDSGSGQLRPVFGYLPTFSTTIKSLAISANGSETFDLGENWKTIDNIVVSLVNGTASTSSAVTIDFANNPVLLNNTSAFPPDVMVGISPNGNTRLSISAGLNTVSFSVKVTERYFRVRVANGTTSAQQANFYVDIRGYSLNP